MSKLVIDNQRSNFILSKVLIHKMLNCADLKNNHNKFYEAKLEVSNNGEFRVVSRYGRVGEQGLTDYRYFITPVVQIEAEKAYNKLIKSKLNGKGSSQYREIDVETETRLIVKVDIKSLPPIEKLIMQLYEEAMHLVKTQVQTPLGQLSKEQINKAKSILNRIYDALQSKSQYSILEDLSSELYTNVPQRTQSRLVRLPIIDSYEKLQNQMELLEVISSLITVQGALDGNAKEKYEATGANIEVLPKDTKEWNRIEKYIKNSESRHHNANLHVLNIYKTNIKGEKEKFNPYNLKVMELFHGTRSANILNILTQGLLIKPKTAVHTGSMFGNGIYFADQSTKSTQYAHKWANNKHDTSYLFLCDVAVGKVKEYDEAQVYLTKPPMGYDSVKGVVGRQLIHNEYIVYNTNQSLIKYIIEFAVSKKYK